MTDWGYSHEGRTISEKRTGKIACVITDAVETTSKAGNPMIVITVRPSKSSAFVRCYMVKNEWFNRRMSAFFDAFPAIGDGNFNLIEWVGAEGVAFFDTDENGYLKVKFFLRQEECEDVPAYEGPKPAKVKVMALEEAEEPDGLPF